jgi:hypothetical protein
MNDRQVLMWDSYTDPYEGAVKFRLTYEGNLLGSSNKNPHARHKHQIRMKFHSQLKRLWERHPELVDLKSSRHPDYRTAVEGREGGLLIGGTPYIDLVSATHQQFNRNWFPIVLEETSLTCSVDILFLRQGSRGSVLNAGDIDGRLKTLFDALAIPRSASDLGDPDPNDQPVYVLLQDDSMISHASVEADELLEPTSDTDIQHDSRVIITVNVRMTRPNWRSLRFAGD